MDTWATIEKNNGAFMDCLGLGLAMVAHLWIMSIVGCDEAFDAFINNQLQPSATGNSARVQHLMEIPS